MKDPISFSGALHFRETMLLEASLNAESMEGLSIEAQGVAMGAIFDLHRVVIVTLPEMKVREENHLLKVKGGKWAMEAMGERTLPAYYITAFTVGDKSEGYAFQEIFAFRQLEIESLGKMTPEINEFWERMTPAGRIAFEPRLTVRRWSRLMKVREGAAELKAQVVSNDLWWQKRRRRK